MRRQVFVFSAYCLKNQQSVIKEIIQILRLVPNIIYEEMNNGLDAKVSNDHILSTLNSFKKDKSPSPNGLSIEFYLRFFDLLKEDLIKVVWECLKSLGRSQGF